MRAYTSKGYSWRKLKSEVPALDALEVLALRVSDEAPADVDGLWDLFDRQIRAHVGPYRHRCGMSEPDGEMEAFVYSDDAYALAAREVRDVLYRKSVLPEVDQAAE